MAGKNKENTFDKLFNKEQIITTLTDILPTIYLLVEYLQKRKRSQVDHRSTKQS